MTLVNDLHARIATSTTQLLREHAAHPFHILRERGAVAALRSLLLNQAPLSTPVTARLKRQDAMTEDASGTCETLRVQMEITVLEPVDGLCGTPPRMKTVDLAVLSDSPVLVHTTHGDGDVLQRMPAESLAAAIEIKACPTNIPAQKGLVLEDLFALLSLCETHGIQAHFVLLDKAQGLYGRTHDGQHSHLVWDAVHTQTFVIKHKGRKLREFPSFQSAGLVVERGHQAPCDTPFVTCWFLAPGQDGRWHADSRRIRRM